jgi:hypothetical protein
MLLGIVTLKSCPHSCRIIENDDYKSVEDVREEQEITGRNTVMKCCGNN